MDMLLIFFGLTSTQLLILESVIFSWCIQHHLYFSDASIASLACSFFIFLFIPSILLSNLPSFYHPFSPSPFCFPPSFPLFLLFLFFLNFIFFCQFLQCFSSLEFLFWAFFSLDSIQIHRSFVWTHEVSLEFSLPRICCVFVCMCVHAHTCLCVCICTYWYIL